MDVREVMRSGRRSYSGPPARGGRHRGFTLVEAAFVTMVVGLSCAALMQLLTAGTVANAESAELTSAVNLANNVHEATLGMTYVQVVNLNAKTYAPPVDSRMRPVADLGSSWSQRVTVTYVDPNNLPSSAGNGVQPTARVTVAVSHNNNVVYTTRWVVAYVP